MINLFNRSKLDINSITFPNFGWPLKKEDKEIKQWINPDQSLALSINFFDSRPDLPNSMDVEDLRDFYRTQVISANGGIIEVTKCKLSGHDSIRTIFKIPQQPKGITYLASITIPFKKGSFVIKVQAPEFGITGARDNIVAMKLLNSGEISASEKGYEGWTSDPYESKITEGTLMNLSEKRKYDKDFPEHPLSQARAILDEIEPEIKFAEGLKNIRSFGQ